MSIKDTAEALGVGRETVRKMIVSGELAAVQVLCPGGKSYRVDLETARQALKAKLAVGAVVAEVAATVAGGAAGLNNVVAEAAAVTEAAPNRSDASMALAELSLRALVAEQERAKELEQSLACERIEKERALRQADALSHELNKYRFALAEQAESLNEERALRMTLEARESKLLDNSKVSSLSRSSGWSRFRRWFGLGDQSAGGIGS